MVTTARKDYDELLAAYDANTRAGVDDMLRLISTVRNEKPRDPLRRLEDALLDLRPDA